MKISSDPGLFSISQSYLKIKSIANLVSIPKSIAMV